MPPNATQPQAIAINRPNLVEPAGVDVIAMCYVNADPAKFERLEMRAAQMSFSVLADGSIMLTLQAVIPHDQIVKKPSKLLIGVGDPSRTFSQWWADQVGLPVNASMQMLVKRGTFRNFSPLEPVPNA